MIFKKVIAGAWSDDRLILISTHQVKDLENLIDHIIILDEGQVLLHKNLEDVASQLHFGNTQKLEKEVLYSESAPGGYHVITQRVNGNTSVDLELLFNAVTNGHKLFQNE